MNSDLGIVDCSWHEKALWALLLVFSFTYGFFSPSCICTARSPNPCMYSMYVWYVSSPRHRVDSSLTDPRVLSPERALRENQENRAAPNHPVLLTGFLLALPPSSPSAGTYQCPEHQERTNKPASPRRGARLLHIGAAALIRAGLVPVSVWKLSGTSTTGTWSRGRPGI